MKTPKETPELSIILPCRNEEKALQNCISEIKETIKKNSLNAEIIVSDSSTDSSPEIAKRNSVILVKHDKEGYGRAYLEAFKIARGNYLFLADADGTYDFKEIPKFLSELKKGADLVIGNRFAGKMQKEAMPWSHKCVGNPMLSAILRLFFKVNVKDAHCGMRAITRDALNNLNLKTTGMEFASEMIIKAAKNGMKIEEIPIKYRKREGESKLKAFSDGWRHLRFMLLYSPIFLFFIPGLFFFLLGLISIVFFYFDLISIAGVHFFYHPMFLSAMLIIIGYQLAIFALFSKSYALNHLGEEDKTIEKICEYLTLEKASVIGAVLSIAGITIFLTILIKWLNSGFGELQEVKNSIIALTLIITGMQTIFSAFMLSILSIKEK
jgi:glycosyltransferase involved in cell wall biosynthesis